MKKYKLSEIADKGFYHDEYGWLTPEITMTVSGNIEVSKNIIFERALYQASCKAAIKAGREYVEAHTEWIVEQLMKIPDITFCPHGRPVAMELSKSNLDHQFERT